MNNLLLNKNYYYNKKFVNYGFNMSNSYVSLINPFFFNHYSYETYKTLCYDKPNEKIYVKQSYMILTWFHYLNFLNKNNNLSQKKKLSLISLPTKKKFFTITKAPIAHKTNSKEQIQVKFFYYKIIYKNYLKCEYSRYKSFFTNNNQLLLFLLIAKNTFSLSETNLLFLKNAKIVVTFLDVNFFSY